MTASDDTSARLSCPLMAKSEHPFDVVHRSPGTTVVLHFHLEAVGQTDAHVVVNGLTVTPDFDESGTYTRLLSPDEARTLLSFLPSEIAALATAGIRLDLA